MKFLSKFLLTVIITMVTAPFFPFWVSAAVILAINFWMKSNWASSFFSGFFGMGIVWAIYAWMLSTGDATLINTKVSEILMNSNPDFMFLASGFIGALTGGISGLAGYLFIKPVKKNMSNNPYH